MFKQSILIGLLCFSLVAATACKGGGKYADAIEVNDKFISAVEQYTTDLDKASNSGEIVAAIDGFAEKVKELGPQMKAMAEKYPELKDPKNLPPELAESNKRAEEMGKKMMNSFSKLMPHLSDPAVAEAQARLGQSMMSISAR